MEDTAQITGCSIEEAAKRLTDAIRYECRDIPVQAADSYGMISAKDLIADIPVPSFARSAMDGYAVKATDVSKAEKDTPVKLKVTAEVFAGDHSRLQYLPGTAVRIMTGGMIPEGYDAVIKQEDTDQGEEEVTIYSPAVPFLNYCPVGENIKQGECVVPKGKRIGRTEAGLISSMGLSEVLVKAPLKVSIIATGSELLKPGEDPVPGKIYASISSMIGYAVKSYGFEVGLDEICPDDEEAIKDRIIKASEVSDVVISTGGVSVGKRDLMHKVLDDIGAHKLFYRADIQPGTPTIGSVYNGKIILSLSGNPYAALVNFDIYFWEVAAKLTGSLEIKRVRSRAVLCDAYPKRNKFRRFIKGRYEGGRVHISSSLNRSSVIGDMSDSNCYIDIPADSVFNVGDTVDIVLF